MKNSYLFKPITIGGIRIKNRIVMPAMDTNFGSLDGTLTPKMEQYYLERARGGFGLIITEAASVSAPAGRISANQPRINDTNVIAGWWNLIKSTHAFGSKIIMQLHHAGLQANPAFCNGLENVSASDVSMYGMNARAASCEEIEKIINDFIQGAVNARLAGFDGIEIHAAHMYIINQFLSPLINYRQDEFGGSKENRVRILQKIVEGIRLACPKPFIISVRFPGQDFVPGGITKEDAGYYAKICEKVGADLLNVTNGYITSGNQQFETQWDSEGARVFLADYIRKQVSIPVACVGKLQTPDFCNQIIKEEKTDLVCLGRQSICDPAWANKVLFGREKTIRTCLSCNGGCMQGENTAKAVNPAVQCVLNPYVGYESIYRENNPIPVSHKKKIVVFGGGVSAMQFAITASDRGHEVEVFEKSDELGGQLRLAAIPPYKECIEKARQWFISELKCKNVKVNLGIEADVKYTDNADVIVMALGSEQNKIPLKGIENAVGSWEVLKGNVEIKQGMNVVIIGGGQVSCETAHWLLEEGCKVTILEILPEICMTQEIISKLMLQAYLNKTANVQVCVKAQEITSDAVIYINKEGDQVTQPADLVIYAVGQKPVADDLYKELLNKGKEVYKLGDFNMPGDIRSATRNAVELAYSL